MDLLQTHNLAYPYCGETIQVAADCSIPSQEYIEDCQVCCQPIALSIFIEDGQAQVHASHENE